MADGKSILILGASRGIGLGLAREFARRGWQVAVVGRHEARTHAVAARVGQRPDDGQLADRFG